MTAGLRARADRLARRLPLAGMLVAAGLVGGCEAWPDWDNVFRKRYFGWLQSDAGNAILIGSKVLWVFGDTYVHADQDLGTRTTGVVFGNTIMIHPVGSPASTPPAATDDLSFPTTARYFARNPATGQTPWDITYAAVPTIAGEFFGNDCTSYGGPIKWPGSGIYQSGSLALFTYQLKSYQDWTIVKQRIHRHNGVPNESNLGAWTCQAPTEIPNQYATESPTPCELAQDPNLLWGLSVAKIPSGQTDAGHTYVFGWRAQPCYVDPQTCPSCSNIRMHVAKVEQDSAIFTYPTGWKFLYKAGSVQCGAASTLPCWKPAIPNNLGKRNMLHVAADGVAGEFSVEWVVPQGKPGRWVLVHGGLAPLLRPDGTAYDPGGADLMNAPWLQTSIDVNYRQVVLRTSDDPKNFPGPLHGARYPATGTPVGSTVRSDTIAFPQTEPGTGNVYPAVDPNVVSGYNAYRNVHAVKGHAMLSTEGNMMVTYYVWGKTRCAPDDSACGCAVGEVPDEETGKCPGARTDADLYYSQAAAGAANELESPLPANQVNAVSSFRSLKFPLKYVHPWCTSETPATCPPAP